MLDFSHRSHQKELLDANDIPAADVKLNMKELNTINTLLGGHHITLQGFKKLAGRAKQISVMEIGCGGGDNLRVIEQYCTKRIAVKLTGIDMNADICDFARENNPDLNIQCCDYRLAVIDTTPDIIFSSLFCHHFTDAQLIEQIQWMKANARIGFFINDLHRHQLAYYAIKLLTSLFSNSYLVKNDAPLSVARGFTMMEWRHIFAKAGILNFSIEWKWAFRHLICFKHER